MVGHGDVSALAFHRGGSLLCGGGSLRHAIDHLPHGLVELLLGLHLGLHVRGLDRHLRDSLHLGRKRTHLLEEVLNCSTVVQALCHLVDATAHNVPGLGRLERERVPHDLWDAVQTRDSLLEVLLLVLVLDLCVLDQVTHLRQLVLHVFEDRRGTLLQHLLDMLRQLLDGGQGIFCTLQLQLVAEALGLRMDPILQLLVRKSEWHCPLPQVRGLGKSQPGSLCILCASRAAAAGCLRCRLGVIEEILQSCRIFRTDRLGAILRAPER
mmetsp:Transcript_19612/g.51403  ORF Transcript_19612/g.51403 Transcript_19612/m.51403 type:complete len:267 (+) Transcript_19612:960-1760(+)